MGLYLRGFRRPPACTSRAAARPRRRPTDTGPRRTAVPTRLTVYNLDTLEPIGEIAGIGGNGAAVDPKSGHGFTSSRPVSMFDTKTMKLIKTIDVGTAAAPDGIYFDPFNEPGLHLQPSHERRDRHRRQGRHGARNDRSGRRAGAGGGATATACSTWSCRIAQGSVTAVDAKTMKAVRALPAWRQGPLQRPRAGREKPRSVRGVRQSRATLPRSRRSR